MKNIGELLCHPKDTDAAGKLYVSAMNLSGQEMMNGGRFPHARETKKSRSLAQFDVLPRAARHSSAAWFEHRCWASHYYSAAAAQ